MPKSLRLGRIALLLCASPATGQVSGAHRDPADRWCTDSASSLLILGTYHFANPGLDAHNLDADDVLSPRRQQEIEVLVARLQRYHPTRVAIEATYGRSPWLDRYKKYLQGEYALGRNEIEQIAFRVARVSGLPSVTAVDFPMWMDGRVPDEIDYDWRPPPADRTDATAPAAPSADDLLLRRSTITEYLVLLNSDSARYANRSSYVRSLLPDSSSNAPYHQADLMTNWYKRNLRIFTNLARTTTYGGDRVLLIIGAGHLSILRDLAIDAPYFCLVDTRSYLD